MADRHKGSSPRSRSSNTEDVQGQDDICVLEPDELVCPHCALLQVAVPTGWVVVEDHVVHLAFRLLEPCMDLRGSCLRRQHGGRVGNLPCEAGLLEQRLDACEREAFSPG